MRDTLNERLAARLRELSERRGFKRDLAERLDLTPSAITPYAQGERRITVDMLEAMSELSGVPLAELVAKHESAVRELNPDEAAIIRALRQWPLSVRQSLGSLLTFFADEPAPAGQTRNAHELWRQMRIQDREWVYGLMRMVVEGALPPDLREGLTDHLLGEMRTRSTGRGAKHR